MGVLHFSLLRTIFLNTHLVIVNHRIQLKNITVEFTSPKPYVSVQSCAISNLLATGSLNKAIFYILYVIKTR